MTSLLIKLFFLKYRNNLTTTVSTIKTIHAFLSHVTYIYSIPLLLHGHICLYLQDKISLDKTIIYDFFQSPLLLLGLGSSYHPRSS